MTDIQTPFNLNPDFSSNSMLHKWFPSVGMPRQICIFITALSVVLLTGNPQRARAAGGADYTFSTASANGPIMAVAPAPTGQIWIGGYFNSVNGSAHSSESYATSSDQVFSIAVLNSDGTLNPDFTFNTFYSGLNSIIGVEWIYSYVRAIAVDPSQNTVYVALANSDNQPLLMRFDPVPGQPGKWTFNSTFTANTAHKMSSLWGVAVGDETIYVAGQVYDNSTTPAYSSMLGKFDLSGNLDNSYAPLNQNYLGSPVYQVRYVAPEAWIANGTGYSSSSALLVAGSFGAAIVSGSTVTAYSSDNATYSDVAKRDAYTAFNCPNPGGDLIAGGCLIPYMTRSTGLNYAGRLGMTMHSYGGTGGPTIDVSTSTNSPADQGSGISRIAALPDGDVLVCGEFTSMHGVYANNLCHFLPDGTVDRAFNNSLSFYPFDMAQQTDGKFVIGGIGLYTAPVFGGVYGEVERLDAFPTNSITINSQPTSQTVYVGDGTGFTVNATGWPTLKAQWKKDGSDLPGQTSQGLYLNNVSDTDAGTYQVLLQNGALCPTQILSSNATLTVLPAPPAPSNDMFNNAVALTGSSVIGNGTIRSATLESGETDPNSFYNGRTVWWTWTAPFTGIATIDVSGCDFDAAAGVYTGTNVTSLTVITNNYDYGYNCECTGILPTFDFNAQAGTVYHIAVGGTPNAGTLGNIVLRVTDSHLVWDQSSSGVTDALYSAATHDNQIVIVGASGTILNSTDASNWTQIPSPANSTWLYSVAYGNGTYVAVGDSGTVITSTDGLNWTNQSSAQNDANLYAVCFAQNQFVTVGDYGAVSTSPDGTNWTAQTSDAFNDITLYSVTASQNKFIAVGDSGLVATSPDAIHWTSQTNLNYYPLWSVAYGASNYVAINNNGDAFISPDGTNWSQTMSSSAPSTGLRAVSYGNGHFIIVGENGLLYLSTDGTNWTSDISGTTDTLENAAYYNNGRFVVTGDDGRILLTKPAQLVPPTMVGNNLQFTFVGLSGSTVVIESTATLSPPNWQPISTNTVANGGVDFRIPATAASQYYRARVE